MMLIFTFKMHLLLPIAHGVTAPLKPNLVALTNNSQRNNASNCGHFVLNGLLKLMERRRKEVQNEYVSTSF